MSDADLRAARAALVAALMAEDPRERVNHLLLEWERMARSLDQRIEDDGTT